MTERSHSNTMRQMLAAVGLTLVMSFLSSQEPFAEQSSHHAAAPGLAVQETLPANDLRKSLSQTYEFGVEQDAFRFAVLGDRTGGHRSGVFAEAIRKVNLLQPDAVFCVGDLIEGYTTDSQELDSQWSEFLGLVEKSTMPFFSVPGNHDISNEVMGREWRRRFGETYRHLVCNDTLFLLLNTEDPPGGHISMEQVAFVKMLLSKYANVRWTFVLLHEPLWTYDEPSGWSAIEALLQGRPHTVIAGHMHKYCYEERHGGTYITLATSGGGSRLRGPNYGEFDHVLWITLTDTGPEVANLMLDGVWDRRVYIPEIGKTVDAIMECREIASRPVHIAKRTFAGASAALELANPTDYPLKLDGHFRSNSVLLPQPWDVDVALPPHSSRTVAVDLTTARRLKVREIPPLEMRWRAVYALPGRPPVEKNESHFVIVMADSISPDQLVDLPFDALSDLVASLADCGYADQAPSVIDFFVPQATSASRLAEVARVSALAGLGSGLAERLGFVTRWRLAGPFSWNPQDSFRTKYINEPTVDPVQPYESDGATRPWRAFDARGGLGKVDLLQAFGDTACATAFACSQIAVPKETEAVLRVGSDDGIRVWINGMLVHEKDAIRGMEVDGDVVPITLRAGPNRVLVQVTQSSEGWCFCLRITDSKSRPLIFTCGDGQTARPE